MMTKHCFYRNKIIADKACLISDVSLENLRANNKSFLFLQDMRT